MKDYRELAEKIVNDLQRRHFIRSRSKEVTKIAMRNVSEILTDHFSPSDKEPSKKPASD